MSCASASWCEAGRIRALGEDPLSIPLIKLFTYECALFFNYCAGSQSTLLLVLLCRQLALVSVRYCFHQAISIDPMRLGPRIMVLMPLCYRDSLDSGLVQSPRICAHRAQRWVSEFSPDPSQLQEPSLPVGRFFRC